CSVSSPGNGTAILSILVSRVSRKSCRFVSRSVSITAADQRSSSVEVDGLYTHFLFALIPGDGHTNRSGTDGKERHISLGGGVNFSDMLYPPPRSADHPGSGAQEHQTSPALIRASQCSESPPGSRGHWPHL